jgi:hypothetical protein
MDAGVIAAAVVVASRVIAALPSGRNRRCRPAIPKSDPGWLDQPVSQVAT